MRVGFTAAYEGRLKFRKHYKAILDSLKSVDPSIKEWIWRIRKPKSKISYEEVYGGKINRVKRAEVLVAEISYPSIGVGFEIFYALGEKKQVLALYFEEAQKQASETIRGITSRYLTVKSYNLKDLSNIIEKYFKGVSKKLEVKFNCILPPRLDSYLKEKAKKEKTTKSAIVRSLIEREVREDLNTP